MFNKFTVISTTLIVLLGFSFYSSTSIQASSKKKDNLVSIEQEMPASKHVQSIVLGAGCFWGAEKRYQAIPGVIEAISGYAGGSGVRATYKEITKYSNKNNKRNHAEVVNVVFNESVVSLETILQSYFEGHDPTQVNRQGNDIGTQYRSIILTTDEAQTKTTNKVLKHYQQLLDKANYGTIATQVKPLKRFFKAETYHQDYLVKNPNGYCPDHSTGITFTTKQPTKAIDNTTLLSGKQIIVIESDDYCSYCEKFKKDVLEQYKGTIAITSRLATQLDGFSISTPTWATPTILFIEDGKEVYGRQGYMSPKQFYKALGAFKLGNTEAYKVAFNEGTDAKYCKEYEIFKNTPDGVFIDKLSGEPLFDTKDRFNSRSGWLSFTKPIEGSTYRKKDNSYGMKRVEIRSLTSDIHLGHVFDDGPNGKSRFCINATVLEFVARENS